LLSELGEFAGAEELDAVHDQVLMPAEVHGGPPALPAFGPTAGIHYGTDQADDHGFLHICSCQTRLDDLGIAIILQN